MRRILVLVALVLAGLAVLLLSWPQVLGAQRLIGVAQLIAFRALLAIGLGALALLAGVVALLGSRRRGRPEPVLSLGLAVLLALGAILNCAVLMARGSSSGAAQGDLVVMAWNAQGGATSPATIARVAAESGADVVSLPETDEEAAAEVARLLSERGIVMTPHTVRAEGAYDWIPTSVLIADDVGAYDLDTSAGSTPGLPSGLWRRTAGTGPEAIVAAHPMPPLPDSMDGWEAGLRWVAEVCRSSGPDVVIAGDFNATVDHMTDLMDDCGDAALEAGGAASGTWPADAPSWISSPIDHVLLGSAWTAKGVRVLDGDPGGSDHRPIVAVLGRQ
ncbi:endonuclease/exonuclease/phosphatase family protein [Microbacterium sp. ARD32]|uniref:endonuclease/exonuclease/phosphatase family protein n=1 Tax=Microbacterium sp. ARD32 TaxID=2962577 RepID=UPI002880C600|nr:endonuclease/exonuclease/phosphatase family protein [Microbacterium sp. ARD32]MDT0157034.1 endonuclease/exonuclease/phosphatase family protein [Microbacterium sp. ARD32]